MWSESQSLTTAGPDITFNTGEGTDRWILDPKQCRWVTDVRRDVSPNPRTPGATIFPALKGAGHLFLGGLVLPATDTAAARDALLYSMEQAADALFASTGTYSQPSGRGTATVGIEVYPALQPHDMGAYRFTFSMVLVVAGPGWV